MANTMPPECCRYVEIIGNCAAERPLIRGYGTEGVVDGARE